MIKYIKEKWVIYNFLSVLILNYYFAGSLWCGKYNFWLQNDGGNFGCNFGYGMIFMAIIGLWFIINLIFLLYFLTRKEFVSKLKITLWSSLFLFISLFLLYEIYVNTYNMLFLNQSN